MTYTTILHLVVLSHGMITADRPDASRTETALGDNELYCMLVHCIDAVM